MDIFELYFRCAYNSAVLHHVHLSLKVTSTLHYLKMLEFGYLNTVRATFYVVCQLKGIFVCSIIRSAFSTVIQMLMPDCSALCEYIATCEAKKVAPFYFCSNFIKPL